MRAAFTKANATEETDEGSEVAQFFHILDAVAFTKGCAVNEDGREELTIYSACMNTQKGIYYYKTYSNNQISAVYFHCKALSQRQGSFWIAGNFKQVTLQKLVPALWLTGQQLTSQLFDQSG